MKRFTQEPDALRVLAAGAMRGWQPDATPVRARKPGRKSERIVVDEIIPGESDAEERARLLRARYDFERGKGSTDLEYWVDEREDVISAWRVAAFVGMQAPRRLQEGDVFLVLDGSLLHDRYEPIARAQARREHLLLDWVSSRELARQQMKREFRVLALRQSLGAEEGEARQLVERSTRSLLEWEE